MPTTHLPPIPKSYNAHSSTTPSEDDDAVLMQGYGTYIAQLRGLLEDATGEVPTSVNTSEVERRMGLIQTALSEVECRDAEVRRWREMKQNQKFLDTYERRIKDEEEQEKKRQSEDKERTEQVSEMRNLQVAYYKDRNDRTDTKAVHCRQYNEQVQEETVIKAGSNELRRTQNIEKLMQERERQRRELHDREKEKQEYAFWVRQRREEEAARELAERERMMKIHEQQMETKLAHIRESKRSKWVSKKEASRARSTLVIRNGEKILETERLDHAKLLEDLDAKQRSQAQRYAEEKAERTAYLNQRAQFRDRRHDKQQQNLLGVIDKRLTRGAEIIRAAEKKKERSDHSRATQMAQYTDAGRKLHESLWLHQQRAIMQDDQRRTQNRLKNYRRWNTRAARVMEELRDVMSRQEAALERQQSADSSSRSLSRSHSQISTHAYRGVPLPTPADFNV